MVLAEAIAHFHTVVARFAPMIQQGLIAEWEARDAIERQIFAGRIGAALSPDEQWNLADRALLALAQAVDAPQMAATRDIRIALRQMVKARTPAAEMRLACFRLADGRLPTREIEALYAAEISAIIARNNARSAAKNDG